MEILRQTRPGIAACLTVDTRMDGRCRGRRSWLGHSRWAGALLAGFASGFGGFCRCPIVFFNALRPAALSRHFCSLLCELWMKRSFLRLGAFVRVILCAYIIT